MDVAAACACVQVTSHPLLWAVLKLASMIGSVCSHAQLRRHAWAFLRDHSVLGKIILPGAAMLEMVMAFGKVAFTANVPLHVGPLRGQADAPCTGNKQGTHWLTCVFQCLSMGAGTLWHGKGVQ